MAKRKGDIMARKPTKIVTWECDKDACGFRNAREIPLEFVIYDDICDKCHKKVHEPLTIDLAIRDNKKKTKPNNQ